MSVCTRFSKNTCFWVEWCDPGGWGGLRAVLLPCCSQTSMLCCGILHDTHVNSRREIYWLHGVTVGVRVTASWVPSLLPLSLLPLNHYFFLIFYLQFSFILCPDLSFILPSFWSFVSSADLLQLRGCWGGELWSTATGLFLSALVWQCSQVVTHFFTLFLFFSSCISLNLAWPVITIVVLSHIFALPKWTCHGRTNTINLAELWNPPMFSVKCLKRALHAILLLCIIVGFKVHVLLSTCSYQKTSRFQSAPTVG